MRTRSHRHVVACAARAAAIRWRFEQARRDGQPIPVFHSLIVDFR